MAAVLLLLLSLALPASASDTSALLLLKSSFTNTTALSSWSPTSPTAPCDDTNPWAGLICFHGILTGLRLSGMGLGGTINVAALAQFRALRTASFTDNSLSGPFPDFSRLPALKAIYLSNNSFSGHLPDNLFATMHHLKKLCLDGNQLAGPIPSSLSNATHIIELRLDRNHLSGHIPDVNLPSLKSFNVSGNDLTGPIPDGLARFPTSCFNGNAGLCGPPLGRGTCGVPPAPEPAPTAPDLSPPLAATDPKAAALPSPPPHAAEDTSGRTVVVVVGSALVVAMVCVGWVTVRKRQREDDFDELGVDRGVAATEAMEAARSVAKPLVEQSEKRIGSTSKRSGSSKSGGGGGRGGGSMRAELVMVSEEKGVFGLRDLMKAAAEVLGNGGLGSAYKAVMDGGVAVVVKRMREMNKVGKDVFDVELRRLGRLRHRNVLAPLAYHYRKEEKLVVFEFVPKGSLLYVLHGDRGPDHAALDWPTRLKIALGVARGLAYLHAELAPLPIPHGNLKSSNVLLGPDFEPLISDYGYISLVNPSQACHSFFAYKSPEATQYRHVSPKSDVYCLGIVILELITGKFPSQYLNNTKGGTDVVQWAASAITERREAELLDPEIGAADVANMVRMLRFGSACANVNPEQRPDMKDAAAMMEEIAAATGFGGGGGGGDAEGSSLIDCYAEVPLSSNGRDDATQQ